MKREMIEKIYEIVENFDEKHEWTDEYDFLSRVKDNCKKFKKKYEILDKYDVDININKILTDENIELKSEYANIHIWRITGTKESRCYILNSEKQPNNELLMCYDHPTGPYMFGGHSWDGENYYDDELFEQYFDELKTYGYSYIDELNHKIYFTIDNGMKLYKDYEKICEKYQKLFNERMKNNKINKLKEQLKELENEDE